MRLVIAGLLVGAAIANPPSDQPLAPSRLDGPVEGPFVVADPMARGICGVWRTIEQIARRTQIRVGFQNSSGCSPGGTGLDETESAMDLQGVSPRAAFDYLIKLRPEFGWREVDSVVVIRPVAPRWTHPPIPWAGSLDHSAAKTLTHTMFFTPCWRGPSRACLWPIPTSSCPASEDATSIRLR